MSKLYVNRVSVALFLCIALVLWGIAMMICLGVRNVWAYLMFGGALLYLFYAISREPISARIYSDGVGFRHSTFRQSFYRFAEIGEIVYPFILQNERNVAAIYIRTKYGREILLHDSFGALGRDLKLQLSASQKEKQNQ